jgi:hypothetical protein
MHPERIREILEAVASGALGPAEAMERLRLLPFEELEGFRLDQHRHLRTGFPEVVLALGKTRDQVMEAARRLHRAGSPLLVTRLEKETGEALAAAFPAGRWNPRARTFFLPGAHPTPPAGRVAVVSAGTGDLPVAEEALETARAMGAEATLHPDVGIAGIHRLADLRDSLVAARAIVVVAGMEGALPSVVAGLTGRPVVAVPTSVGYGASFGGLAALLGMLNSCAAGVTVVNIDNGFGGGYAAALIARVGAP